MSGWFSDALVNVGANARHGPHHDAPEIHQHDVVAVDGVVELRSGEGLAATVLPTPVSAPLFPVRSVRTRIQSTSIVAGKLGGRVQSPPCLVIGLVRTQCAFGPTRGVAASSPGPMTGNPLRTRRGRHSPHDGGVPRQRHPPGARHEGEEDITPASMVRAEARRADRRRDTRRGRDNPRPDDRTTQDRTGVTNETAGPTLSEHLAHLVPTIPSAIRSSATSAPSSTPRTPGSRSVSIRPSTSGSRPHWSRAGRPWPPIC